MTRSLTEQVLASLTIRGADTMPIIQRKAIARWLKRQAAFLEKDGHLCTKRFRARYLAV